MARQKGLEPLAYCLEGSCSIQLSYWRILKRRSGERIPDSVCRNPAKDPWSG